MKAWEKMFSLVMFFVYIHLGQSVSNRFYKLQYSFTNQKLAACIYILIFLGIFLFVEITAYLLNLIKRQGKNPGAKDKARDNMIFFYVPGLMASAFFFCQTHLSEFDFLSFGIITISTLFALGLVIPIRKFTDVTYLKFSKFFQKYSLLCQVFLYGLMAIISVFMFSLLFPFDSFILRVLAAFGVS